MIYLRILFLGGAFIAGCVVTGWYYKSTLANEYEEALSDQREDFETALAQQEALWGEQLRKTIALERENKQIRERNAALQEEIENVEFNPPVIEGCTAHPVSSAEFRRLYNEAAEAGNPPTERDKASGVPEGSHRE